jgi:AcrR family transcriptional regulator
MAEANIDTSPERTRARILDAALDLFGERGLTGTTVRDIAGRANVNVAAISYYFGGKDELYKAVAQMVIDGIEARLHRRAAPLLDQPPTDAARALEALQNLFEAVVDAIVGPAEMRRVARFVIREQMQPTAAFDILFGTMSRIHGGACRLLGMATGREPETAETRLRVFTLLGQVLVFRVAEGVVLRRMGVDSYDDSFLTEVKALIRANVRAVVTAAREGGS